MDVESEPIPDTDESNIVLHVKGKTGSREVVARTRRLDVMEVIDFMQEISVFRGCNLLR
jgi:hypothetical protein